MEAGSTPQTGPGATLHSTRDFLSRGPSLEMNLLDISPFLSALQKRTLKGFTVDHFVEDVYKYEYLLLSKTPPEGGPRCLRCGNCCVTDLFAFVTDEDMARWAREGRDDILHILKNEAAVWAGDRLVSRRDGHPLQGCPFLTLVGSLATCTIHETRPKVCRNYVPGSSELCPHYKGGEP